MKYIKTYENLLKGKSEEYLRNNLSENELIEAFIKQDMFDKLPRNDDGVCVYEGELDLYHDGLIELPDNLTINGDFLCRYNKLTSLPKNLIVNGFLHCQGNKLTRLPENLNVYGNLFCDNQKTGIILELPHSTNVKGIFIN